MGNAGGNVAQLTFLDDCKWPWPALLWAQSRSGREWFIYLSPRHHPFPMRQPAKLRTRLARSRRFYKESPMSCGPTTRTRLGTRPQMASTRTNESGSNSRRASSVSAAGKLYRMELPIEGSAARILLFVRFIRRALTPLNSTRRLVLVLVQSIDARLSMHAED